MAGGNTIQKQVKLPFRVAFNVVLQGIRIRLGRSIVTISGIVFGIAFLMSILTGQALKRGVQEEDRLRAEATRALNFLTAETGPASGRSFAIELTSEPSSEELRFLRRIASEGGLLRARPQTAQRLATAGLTNTQPIDPQSLGNGVSAFIGVGSEPLPPAVAELVLSHARQRVLAATRTGIAAPAMPATVFVNVAREPRPEELAARAEEARKARFRQAWIIAISLMVTLIGISNAMLMSVTERFREIGTMKCLGALSAFVRRLFIIEAGLMGVAGALAGILFGFCFALVAYGITYGLGITFTALGAEIANLLLFSLLAFVAGIILSILAALYPAQVAARMVPAHALRSNV